MTQTGKYIIKSAVWILITLFAVIIASGIFIYFMAESYIEKNLSEFVAEKSNNLYELTFEKIDLKLNPLTLTISQISLEANKQRSKELLLNEPNKNLYSFHSEELKLSNIHLCQFLKNKSLYIKILSIEKPKFSISGKSILINDSTKNIDEIFPEIWPLFQDQVKEIRIDEIHIEDANYRMYHSGDSGTEISNARKISMQIVKFRTDSTLIYQAPTFFESDDIIISIDHFQNNLSDSLHFLNIEKLEYSLKTTDIFAHQFHLGHKEKNTSKNLYDVRVPSLHLKSKSITGLSLNDTLVVEFLKFENPEIHFFQKENHKKIQVEDLNQFDLYSLVKDQFAQIKVDSFVLSNANLKIYQQPDSNLFQQHFESLNISLSGFNLDSGSAQNRTKLFHANELQMSVNGYHLKLSDKQHELKADSMFISTSKNSLSIKNIQISPTKNSVQQPRTSVNVNCESLEIENINFKTLFHTRTLPTRHIRIRKPIIKLQHHSEIERRKEKNETGVLFKLVSAYLKGVYSEVVEIEKGQLSIETLENSVLKGYFETNFSFNLSGFALDSASMQQTDKFFYANNFELLFSDYQMKLADNLHKINVDKISIQSFDRKLQIENLRLTPTVDKVDQAVMKSFNRSELYKISIPRITLWDINLQDAFFHNKLNIARFHVSQPKIYFENFGILREQKEKTDFIELYQLISNYIYDFNIKEISIPKGNFVWINHTRKGKTTSFDNEFSASLQGFRLNESEMNKHRLFFSDDFEISVKDQVFQLSDSVHVLEAGEISLSSKTSSIKIKDAFLYPLKSSNKFQQLSTTFQVTIPDLQISGFDFPEASKSKSLHINRLELKRPKFQIYSKKGVKKSLDLNRFNLPLPALLNSFHINQFKIINGEVINYETDGLKQIAQSSFKANLTLPNISLKNTEESGTILTTENLILNLSNFKTPLGKNHTLELEELDFNRSQQQISILGLEINPLSKLQNGNRFTVFAPQINLSGFDIDKAIKNNYFEFNQIKITEPKVKIEITDSINGDKLELAKNMDLFPIVEPYLNKIKINTLAFQDVNLNFNWFNKTRINKPFNISFEKINIASDTKNDNLLNSEKFEISTSNLQTTSKNGYYKFHADSLIYNSAKHSTLLKNIKVIPLFSPHDFHKKIDFQTDYLQVQTKYIEIKGMDENEWFKSKKIKAEKVIIGPSNIEILRNKKLPFNTAQRPPWPQELLKNIEQDFIFDSLFLLPSTLKYSELQELSDLPGFIDFTDLKLRGGKISNIPEEIKENPNLRLNASAKLYNKGLLEVQLDLDMGSSNYKHSISGKLSPMTLTPINNMLERSSPVSIEAGQLKRFDFKLAFTDKSASGELLINYEDFKISILNKNHEGAKRARLASFWANKMVLNSKFPKGDKTTPISIYYKRDIQRSIINYWWKALFTGTKESLGIKPEKSR